MSYQTRGQIVATYKISELSSTVDELKKMGINSVELFIQTGIQVI